MKPTIVSFVLTQSRYYWRVIANAYRFLPHLFSVPLLMRTLFSPWKRVYRTKQIPGFSFEEFLGRTSFNIISAIIGCILRMTVLTVCMLLLLGLTILVAPIFLAFLLWVVTVKYPLLLLAPTEEEHKQRLREQFLRLRAIKPEYQPAASAWFSRWYETHRNKADWSGLDYLFALPPIGRDWHMGFSVTLDRYSTELTRPSTHAPQLVGRKKEIDQMEVILTKSAESNVVIVGIDGVGKHTIVEELAKRLYEGKTVSPLAYKRMLLLSTETILSTSSDPSGKRDLVRQMLEEAAGAGNIILVIDAIDRYVSEGIGRIDLTDVIEPFAKGRDVQMIGITTPTMYQTYLYPNGKINRLFQKVDVSEISREEAITILMDATPAMEARFRIIIPFDTIHAVVEKSENYITHIPFPEKAIELLDEACASASHEQLPKTVSLVTPEVIDAVLSQKTHIPTKLTQHTIAKLNTLESALSVRIIDQPEAIARVAAAIRRAFLVFGKRKKPMATLLLLGPTGVGKTQTAKELAAFFFDSETYLYRLDMATYQTKEDIHALIGTPDKRMPGILTQTIREHPYGVLLLDELEKADKGLRNIFLTMIDEGYFPDGAGELVNCKNLIIIATSNAGSDLLYQDMTNTARTHTARSMTDYLVEKDIFEPEFLNRFDEIILYRPLSVNSFVRIARLVLKSIVMEIKKQHNVRLVVTDAHLNGLIEGAYDQKFGARNMERILKTHIEDVVAKKIFSKEVKEGDTITLDKP